MSDRFFVLLVHSRTVPFDSLKSALTKLNIATSSVGSLEGARRLIRQTEPDLIFTDTALPDGSWPDVIKLANHLGTPTSVIVVSPLTDIKLYWAVRERGAHDFIMPPFELDWLALIVQRAVERARYLRHAQARAAEAWRVGWAERHRRVFPERDRTS